MSSDSLLSCPFCMAWLGEPSLVESGRWDGKCTRCHRDSHVEVYPVALKKGETGKAGEAIVDDTHAACMKHPARQAVDACSQCGRFMCDTCRVDLGGTMLCPECTERALRGETSTTKLVQSLGRAEQSIAALLLLPLYLGLFFGVIAWYNDASDLDALGFAAFFTVPTALIFYPYALYLRRRKSRTPTEKLPTSGLTPIPIAVRPWLGFLRPLELLLGFGDSPALETSQLYIADNHLLIVRKSGIVERYQRIYYRDITAVRVQRAAEYLLVLPVLVLVLLLIFGSTWWPAVLAPREHPFAIAWLAICSAWLGGMLLSNAPNGLSCHVDLYTPVSRVRLTSIGRKHAATRALAEISRRIAQHQGAWAPGAAIQLRDLDLRYKAAPTAPKRRPGPYS